MNKQHYQSGVTKIWSSVLIAGTSAPNLNMQISYRKCAACIQLIIINKCPDKMAVQATKLMFPASWNPCSPALQTKPHLDNGLGHARTY
jgi:hypothetical protein